MAYDAGVSDADLSAISDAVPDNLERWGIDSDAGVTLLNHSENTTFAIDDGDTRRILRVHRLGYHTRDAIAAELAWVQAIRKDTPIRTAEPIAGADGDLIQSFDTRQPQPRHAVLFEFLAGNEPEESGDLVGSFEQLGVITARLHHHSQQWAGGVDLASRPHWDFACTLGDTPIWGDWRRGIGMDVAAIAHIQRGVDRIAERLAAFGTGPDRFGLIHADLRLANLLVHDGDVRVIDFDDCGLGWYLYDLASALSFIEHQDNVPALIDAWARGYSSVRPLSTAERDMIPTFVLLRRILLVAWLGSHGETALAAELGVGYTEQTLELVSRYLDGRVFR